MGYRSLGCWSARSSRTRGVRNDERGLPAFPLQVPDVSHHIDASGGPPQEVLPRPILRTKPDPSAGPQDGFRGMHGVFIFDHPSEIPGQRGKCDFIHRRIHSSDRHASGISSDGSGKKWRNPPGGEGRGKRGGEMSLRPKIRDNPPDILSIPGQSKRSGIIDLWSGAFL